MTKIIFLGFTICYLLSGICKAQWISIGLNPHQVVTILANDSNIFAGQYNGVYRSTNGGASWQQIGLSNINILAFAVSGNNLFVGTEYNGVYLTTNNGQNWTLTGLYNLTIDCLLLNGSNLFAGVVGYGQGVYLSSNNGKSWTLTSLNYRWVNSLASNGSYLFAGTQGQGVYLSTNNGQSWTQTSLNNRWVCALAISATTVFAGISQIYGIYVSTNNGLTWMQSGLTGWDVNSVVIDGSNTFAGTESGVYLSTNNGQTWTQRNEGLGNLYIWSLSIAGGYIYAGAGSGAWKRPLNEFVKISPISNSIPKENILYQNYPNPFNPTSKIKYEIANTQSTNQKVTLTIYNALGEEIAVLVNEEQSAGIYEVDWDAGVFPSGVYYYKLSTGDFTETRKMVVIK